MIDFFIERLWIWLVSSPIRWKKLPPFNLRLWTPGAESAGSDVPSSMMCMGKYGHLFCSGESDWQVLSNQSMLPTCSFSTNEVVWFIFLCTLGFYLIVPAISLFFDALTQAALLLVSNRFVHCNLLITHPPSWTTGIPSYKSISTFYLAWLSCRLFQDTSCPVASKGGRRLA